MVAGDAKVAEIVCARIHVDRKPLGWVAPALLQFPNADATAGANVEMDRCYTAADIAADLSARVGFDQWKAD